MMLINEKFEQKITLILNVLFQAKHIQFVSGVDSISYWTATYCWDLINFLVPAVCLIIIFAAFNLESYRGADFGALVLVLVSFFLSLYCIKFHM